VFLAALERAPPRATYNVSDGHPVLRRDFYGALAELIGAPRPSFVERGLAADAQSRDATDKRVSNRRMLRELSVRLRYPTYREGLPTVLSGS
jgi:hypothetical protein